MLRLFCLFSFSVFTLQSAEYFEDFKTPGKPRSHKDFTWSYTDQLLPVKGWREIIPGDGFAYLTVDSDSTNNKLKNGKAVKWPFQMISVNGVGPGHSLEMRAKNTAIKGVASFIFTYTEADGLVDEIDIEVVADDTHDQKPHPIDKPEGWSDARFNTWANADPKSLTPHKSIKAAILGANKKKVSHRDGQFHTYRIDWHQDHVDFFIDNIYQTSINKVVTFPHGALDS